MVTAYPDRPIPVHTSTAEERGLTRATLRSAAYTRVRHGTYLPRDANLDDPDTRIAVAVAAMSPRAILGGWAAARWHERAATRSDADDHPLCVFDGILPWPFGERAPEPILVCLPRDSRLRPAPDVRIFRSDLDAEEVELVDGVRVTTPLRTAFDLARLRDRVSGVVALDRLAHLGLVDLGELEAHFTSRQRWVGARRGLRSTRLADAGAESPPETITRLLCFDAGLHELAANATIRRPDGSFVARVDLLDLSSGVVIEYDGGYHASATQRRRDAVRQELLEDLGLVVVRVTASDLATRASRRALVDRVRAAQVRARQRRGTSLWRAAV